MSLEKRRSIPRIFRYNGIICELINFHTYAGFPKTMTIRVHAHMATPPVNPLDLMETLPRDPFFRFLIALHYHASIVGRINMTLTLDEVSNTMALVATFRVALDSGIYNLYAEAVPIFDTPFGCPHHIVKEYQTTVTHRRVSMNDDPEAECDIVTSVQGAVMEMGMYTNDVDRHSKLRPWGIEINVDILNHIDVEDALHDYKIWSHYDVYDSIGDMFNQCVSLVSSILTPNKIMDISYAYNVISSQNNDGRWGMTFFVTLTPIEFNDVEVLDIGSSNVIFGPADPDNTFLADSPELINYDIVYRKAEELVTALYSTDGVLAIPKAVSHSIMMRDGRYYFDVVLSTEVVSFAAPDIFSPATELNRKFANSKYHWVLADVDKMLDYINDKIQVAIPMSGNDPWPERCAILYARVPTPAMISKTTGLGYFIDKFNDPQFAIEVVYETKAWTYLRISDVDDIRVYDDTDPTFQALGESFAFRIHPDTQKNNFAVGIEMLIALFVTSPSSVAFVDDIPERVVVQIAKEHPDWTADRYGVYMLESALYMPRRRWRDYFYAVIDVLYGKEIDANVTSDDEKKEEAPKKDYHEEKSLLNRLFGTGED